jgi:hypothetical protein
VLYSLWAYVIYIYTYIYNISIYLFIFMNLDIWIYDGSPFEKRQIGNIQISPANLDEPG